jgi:ribosomal protein S18 acetylase RimI-like enzyme
VDNAVDDGDEADGDFVLLQKTLSLKRRATKGESRIQKVLPFPFLPNIRPLTISDYQSCLALENAAFPVPEHRASPEKVDRTLYVDLNVDAMLTEPQIEYRLTTCPELSLGIFCTVVPDDAEAKGFDIETLATAKTVETDRPDKAVSVLLAHIVSTRSCSDVVDDIDMSYPRDWRTRGGRPADVGHQESGRTVALHSLAVSPKLQGCGLGKMIIKSYLQQMNNSGLADRVALVCQDASQALQKEGRACADWCQYLVSYYERFGFKQKGKSKAQFGGGGWHDMVSRLKKRTARC